MKRFLAVALLGVAVVSSVAFSSRVQAQPERQVDEALVNAKVDARLKQVLGGLLQKGPAPAHGLATISGR